MLDLIHPYFLSNLSKHVGILNIPNVDTEHEILVNIMVLGMRQSTTWLQTVQGNNWSIYGRHRRLLRRTKRRINKKQRKKVTRMRRKHLVDSQKGRGCLFVYT